MFFNKKEIYPKIDTTTTTRTILTNPKKPDSNHSLFKLYYDGFGIGRVSVRLSNIFLTLDWIKAWILWFIPAVAASHYCSDYFDLEQNNLYWSPISYGLAVLKNGPAYYQVYNYEQHKHQNIRSFRSIMENISNCGVRLDNSNAAMPSTNIITFAALNDIQQVTSQMIQLAGKCRIELGRGIFQPIKEETENCIKALLLEAHQNCLSDYYNMTLTFKELCFAQNEKDHKDIFRILLTCLIIANVVTSLLFIGSLIVFSTMGLSTVLYRCCFDSVFETFEKEYQKPTPGGSFEDRLKKINYFGDLPNEFTDVITHGIINDPVLLNNRYCHDAKPLLEWWKVSPEKTSPLSPEDTIVSIKPNFLLKEKIESFVSNLEEQFQNTKTLLCHAGLINDEDSQANNMVGAFLQ